jgi:hypothetical protein
MKKIINLGKAFGNISKEKIVKNLQIIFASTIAAFVIHGLVSLYVHEKSFTNDFNAFAMNWAVLALSVIFFSIKKLPKMFLFKGHEDRNRKYYSSLVSVLGLIIVTILILSYDINLPGHKAQLFINEYAREFIFLSYVVSILLFRLQGAVLLLGVITMITYILYGSIEILFFMGIWGILAGQIIRLIFMTDWSKKLKKE